MKIYRLSIILLLVSFITSCSNDVLVEKPIGFVNLSEFFKTEKEIEAALFGVYNFLQSPTINEYYWLLIGDLGTDASVPRRIPSYNTSQFYEMETPNNGLTNLYREHYRAIGSANTVIEKIQALETFTEAFRNEIVGESKYLRAYYYFKLTLLYGDVPLWLNDLNLDEVERLPRVPLADVRKQIVQDLVDAEKSLPSKRDEASLDRVTSWVAKALLARVYLFDNQWQNALTMAEDVINNSGHILIRSYEDLFDFNNHFNEKLIHVIPHLTNIAGSSIHFLRHVILMKVVRFHLF